MSDPTEPTKLWLCKKCNTQLTTWDVHGNGTKTRSWVRCPTFHCEMNKQHLVYYDGRITTEEFARFT